MCVCVRATLGFIFSFRLVFLFNLLLVCVCVCVYKPNSGGYTIKPVNHQFI